jgi:glutathione S-transferase
MKLLDFALAPNPKKVRVYLREKGLESRSSRST